MGDRRGEVTRLLQAGDKEAVLALVYDELRIIAVRHMARERPGHTLQPTALVHEAFLRLFAQDGAAWKERRHFTPPPRKPCAGSSSSTPAGPRPRSAGATPRA